MQMTMYRKFILIVYAVFMWLGFSLVIKAQPQDDDITQAFVQISTKIRDSHTRVVINEDMLGDIQAKSVDRNREHFDAMKDRIDKTIDKDIVFKDISLTDGTRSTDHEYGLIAADAALTYLVTGEPERSEEHTAELHSR